MMEVVINRICGNFYENMDALKVPWIAVFTVFTEKEYGWSDHIYSKKCNSFQIFFIYLVIHICGVSTMYNPNPTNNISNYI